MILSRMLFYLNTMNTSGGIERVVSELANRFISSYDICIFVKDDKKSFYLLDGRVEFKNLSISKSFSRKSKTKRIMSYIFGFLKQRKQLKKLLKIDCFEKIYVTSPYNALIVFSLGKKYKSKLIVSEHGSYYAYNFALKLLKKVIYPRVPIVVVPNKMDTSIYLEKSVNAVYIPHFLPEFKINSNQEKQKIVLSVGRMVADKRQLVLISMWGDLVKKYGDMDWKLMIIGDGYLRNEIVEYIEKEDLSNNIIIINETSNIEEYYSLSSIFVMTSKYEGFGMVLLEAMANRTPCISFDVPSGPKDVIVNEYNGYLIEDLDKFDFIEKLHLLMNDYEHRYLLGQNAFEYAMKWNIKIMDEWRKYLNE